MSITSGADSTETAAGDGRQAAEPARHVRVAVVQMDFHPAVPVPKPSALDDPLFDPKREGSSLLPDSGDASRVVEPLKRLRRRVRGAYLDQLRRKVEAILDACRSWDVQIVVFPEYSIPPALLEPIAKRAGDMVVVAGTHYVDQETLETQVYEKLGALPRHDFLKHAVSPVLHHGRLIGLVPKLHATTPELSFLDLGQEWAPVELPEGLPGPLGVLICLDNLSRQSAQYREYVGGSLSLCRFIAAPSLTPARSLDEASAKALEDTRRHGRPVLFANHAPGGGSAIYVDEGKPPNLRNFPTHAGYLEPGEEGVIVADIDLRLAPVGSSTRYEPVPAIRAFAAASFVYAGIESEYAAWLEKLRAQFDAPTTSKLQQLQAVKALIGVRPSLVEQKPGAQQRRFQVLALELEEESDIERLRQLTREIVIPAEVLPLKALRAALARGAADEVQRWVNECEAGEFGPVANRLQKEWEKIVRAPASWSVKTLRAADEVSDAVRGGRKAPDPKALVACVEVFEAEVERGFEVDNKNASEHFEQGRYAEARDAYRAMLDRARSMIERAEAADRPSLRRWVARCQLNMALASLNLQELDAGRALILAITAEDLPLRGKLELAGALILTGEREKAEEILPNEADMAEGDRTRLVEVRQTIELLDGRVPDPLADSAAIYILAASVLVTRGNLATAAECALGAIQRSKGNALTVAFAVQPLTEALRRTVLELPPDAELISVDRRDVVVKALEAYFSELSKSHDLPATVREDMNKFETIFHGLNKDTDWLPTKSFSDDNDQIIGETTDNPRKLAYRLALDGRTEEALRALLLDHDTHPWRGRFDRVEMLALSKQLDRALDEILALAHDFPDRARVEFLAAELCASQGRASDALKHAERAYAQLPGKGYRLLLVNQRLDNDQAEGAWDLVKDHEDDSPRALYTRARAARQTGRFEEAQRALHGYVKRRPEDGHTRVTLAQIVYRLHRYEEAAAISWNAFADHGDRLNLDALSDCGMLQRIPGPLDAEQRRKILEVAARIKARFSGNAKAEQQRLSLLMTLGDIPEEAGAIDFDLLVRDGRAMIGTGITELADFVNQRNTLVDAVTRLARLGAVPTTTAVAVFNSPLALVITRIFDRTRHAAGLLLCPPISQSNQPPALQLEGATLLISDLELVLLEALEIIPTLREALGPDGRLVLFPSAWHRVDKDFATLRITDPSQLADTEALLRQIEQLQALAPDTRAPRDDVAAARQAGAAIVTYEALADVQRISPKAFLRYLHSQGYLDDAQCAKIMPCFPVESGIHQSLPEPLPERIVVSWFFVEKLFQQGALQAVFEAYHGRLFVGPGVVPWFRSQRDEKANTLRAAELAEQVSRRLVEGWINEVTPPTVTDLPPLRELAQGWSQELILEPLQDILTYRYAVLEHPTWWRLSAEFYGSSSLGAPDLVTWLDWPNEDAYLAIVQKVRRAALKDLTMPALVRLLMPDARDADPRLLKLAELGFPDALGSQEMLRLERRYQGLDKAEPKRVLDNQEWMARTPQHLGGEHARLQLVRTYSATIFETFLAPERALSEKKFVIDALLRRQEIIGAESASNTLDQTLAFLAARTADSWQTVWKQQGERHVLDLDGPIASLWQCLSAWSGDDGSRRAAHGRAIREVWRILSGTPDGPPRIVAAALKLAHWDSRKVSQGISFMEPETEAAAILSFRWKESPFPRHDYDDLLAHGTELLVGNIEFIHPREADFSVFFGEEDKPVLVRVPIEALFLRAPLDTQQSVVKRLKAVQGPYDGILYEFLNAIEESPDSAKLRDDYAKYAAVALFRLVQDDPAFIRIWGQSRRFGASDSPRRIEELRRILSEPAELPSEKSFNTILFERITTGFWADREDNGMLFLMASEIPGTLPSVTVHPWLTQGDYDENVRRCLDRLDHADESPIARIAGDVVFLRVAAARRPLVKFPEGEIDLRDVLPSRLERLLEKVMAPPVAGTLGAAEAALLRVCGEVIQRLASPAVLSIREGLWLTYRLFQWLCRQLDAISPDARRDGILRLVAQAPPPAEQRDILDPFGFGRDLFDQRLAAVLHSLGAMEDLVEAFQRQEQPAAAALKPRSVSSPALEDKLLRLARGAYVGPSLSSELDWNAPGNIPDLSLNALLHLNSERFDELSSEARIRRFEALPDDPQALEKTSPAALSFAQRVVLAAADVAASLEAAERTLLEAKLRSMADGPLSREWCWLVFLSFFAAGMDELEDEARALTIEHLDRRFAPSALGHLLLGVAARDPAHVEQATETILTAAAERGADVVALATGGLGRLVVHGKAPVQKIAASLLLQLAERSPFREDPRMDEVIAAFGLRESKP